MTNQSEEQKHARAAVEAGYQTQPWYLALCKEKGWKADERLAGPAVAILEDRIEQNHYANHPVAAIRFAFEKLDDQEDRIFFLENWMYGHWEILDTEYGDDWVPFVLANPDHKSALTSDAANMRADIDSARAEMPATCDRRPFDDDQPDGYMESDQDWARNNPAALAWLADNHVAVRQAWEAAIRARTPVAAETDKGLSQAPADKEAAEDARYRAMTPEQQDSYIGSRIVGVRAPVPQPRRMSITERESHDNEGSEW